MADLNSVIVVGRLTRDPETRSLSSGNTVTQLGIAVNERYKDGNSGEWSERGHFFDVTVWGAQGENCSKYLEKGRQVAIQGRLTYRQWENKEGQKRSKVEITAHSVQFLAGGEGRRREPESDLGEYREDLPAAGTAAERAGVEHSDDEIPFLWIPASFDDRYEHGTRWTSPLL